MFVLEFIILFVVSPVPVCHGSVYPLQRTKMCQIISFSYQYLCGSGALGLNEAPNRAVIGNSRHPDTALFSGAFEAANFLRTFERQYGDYHPAFQAVNFMEALRRAGQEFKFLFVYLHSAEHMNTPLFCEGTLCNKTVVNFINQNFIAWGGDVRKSEGYQMSNTLKASTFPFCAVVMGSFNMRIAELQQVPYSLIDPIFSYLFHVNSSFLHDLEYLQNLVLLHMVQNGP